MNGLDGLSQGIFLSFSLVEVLQSIIGFSFTALAMQAQHLQLSIFVLFLGMGVCRVNPVKFFSCIGFFIHKALPKL